MSTILAAPPEAPSAPPAPASPAPPSPVPAILKSIILAGQGVSVPGWVVDWDSFRRWTLAADFPSRGQVDFLDGEVWLDLTMEEFFGHNQVKTEFTIVLGALVKSADLGRFIGDRMRLVNASAGLSCEPDAAFAAWETFRSGRVKCERGASAGVMELDGTPDMVLEVVSGSSVSKDTVDLPPLYARAQIPEYWLVDVRTEPLRFDLLRLGESGYAAELTADGWSRSTVFGSDFRLTTRTDPLGHPQFTLEVR